MSKTYTTISLSAYLEQNIAEIEAVRKEVEEIQSGFQTSYVDWRSKHDAELLRLSKLVVDRFLETGTELQAQVQKALPGEQALVEERRKDLREAIIPKYQQELDTSITKGQAKTDKLRKLNPELNQQEEALKASLAQNRQQLEDLNKQIGQRSRGLGSVFHFNEISRLDGQRQRLLGKMEEKQEELSKVRKDWADLHQVVLEEEVDLQSNWQTAIAVLAQQQAELAILDDDASREILARQRAVRYVLDELKAPVDCPAADIKVELDQMVEYNRQTDDYHAGLASVGGLIGMLGSIQEGLRRFNTSVQSLTDQERLYSVNLKPLAISLPDVVIVFNQQWKDILQKVKNEKTICEHPVEFSSAMKVVIESQLSVERIKEMFEAMGSALKAATNDWN